MGSQWGKDSAYLRAMKEGYRSRAAFKLKDLQDRYRIIRDDDNVVDLGAAPGSWLQVERGLTNGKVLGIDLNPIPPLEGVETMVADMCDPELPEKVKGMLGIVNVVVSDASPKLSGHKSYDQARAVELGEIALEFACKVLKPGGNFVVKSFQGQDFTGLLDRVKDHFLSVKAYRSRSSRKGSAEVYIVAKYFVGAGNET
ncbi:23S rRNA (uridine2552-2'-O)-methyltransferase [Methanolinea mesophila]|uniref:RlmE family RNA methyltransferase n=1 Tax=Methanolinea mesophila TaxID=547055 RepID=UPI001AE49F14|nr:RlmE family RNA methyltransferase [Methanolinea mesophila]MBP1927843.1 23S rRNA (uridine2552-2'-O)-methyltransferase [Methanolinea mesophila]